MADKRLIDANWLLELYDMGNELEEYAGVLSVPIPVIRQNIKDAPPCLPCLWCMGGGRKRFSQITVREFVLSVAGRYGNPPLTWVKLHCITTAPTAEPI